MTEILETQERFPVQRESRYRNGSAPGGTWTPASAGVTGERTGLTREGAGVTQEGAGVTREKTRAPGAVAATETRGCKMNQTFHNFK